MTEDTLFKKKQLLRMKGKYIDLSIPKIMGILNVTPDSFYDGGRYTNTDQMIGHVGKMLSEGADIIDVGACSSRPGAEILSADDELARLIRTLDPIRTKYPEIILSVDTNRADIVRKIVEMYDVDIINDISAGQFDPQMTDTIAGLHIPYMIMHMRGTPADMQNRTDYTDVLKEVIMFLAERVSELRLKGVNDVIVDPGFGFSKTIDQCFHLLARLDAFSIMDCPLLVGISRKSMIYKSLGITPDEALNGTTALHILALTKGADLLRVHDVKEARQAVELFLKVKTAGNKMPG
jgi:dihydropteroate synthase